LRQAGGLRTLFRTARHRQ